MPAYRIYQQVVRSRLGNRSLHDDGTGKIRAKTAKQENPEAVTFVLWFCQTAGQRVENLPSFSGIADVVYQKNLRVGAKTFSLGFDTFAFDLYKAISMMNDVSGGMKRMLSYFYTCTKTLL